MSDSDTRHHEKSGRIPPLEDPEGEHTAFSRRGLLGASAVLAGATAAGISDSAHARNETEQFTPKALQQIDAAVQQFLAESGTPGAIVGLWIPGQGTLLHTWGQSTLGAEAAPTTLDRVRIASNTKTYVASLLLQLVDEGLTTLDTPLSAFALDFPQNGTATLAQLLNMTAGIFSYTEDEQFVSDYHADPMMAFTPRNALTIALAHEPYFAPGEGMHYSDTNYILAGLIAEQLTSTPLEQLIQDRFILPYFLSGTSFPTDAAMPGPHMTGYAPATAATPMRDVTESQPGISWAAGAMISVVDDMHAWVELLTDGTLLSPELQALRMQQLVPVAEGSPIRYGLGIMELFGFYGHNGGIAGYSTIMLRDPDDGTTLAGITNLSDEHGGGADTLIFRLIRLLLPGRLPPPATPAAAPVNSPVS